MSDKLVFDLAQEVEGTPNVFVRKDWINILDNQNQNYNNNQSVIDTSQLSNSNKYMSYREAYFSVPFLLTLVSTAYDASITGGANFGNAPAVFLPTTRSTDYAVGLKNWFGQIIHSFTLDYNGTTIIQQTPYVNMWNSFKLMTSLSYSDIRTQGCTIGFYPDDPKSWSFIIPTVGTYSASGTGISNNSNSMQNVDVSLLNNFGSGRGNEGLLRRQQYINFDGEGQMGGAGTQARYNDLLQGGASNACKQVWKSYVCNKVDQTFNGAGGPALTQNTKGAWQCAIVATIYLKHIHSFFNMCPLLKGVFMKMTMNLNNTSTSFTATSISGAGTVLLPTSLSAISVSNPLGGINPAIVASGAVSGIITSTGVNGVPHGGYNLFPVNGIAGASVANTFATITYGLNISVGKTCLDSQLIANVANGPNGGTTTGPLSQSIYLYIPAYTFNPVFEQAYLSSPVKQIKYTDIYQYQVLNVSANSGNFNNLLTNGIANIKSVLILPFYSSNSGGVAVANAIVSRNPVNLSPNTGFIDGTPVWQSPFDPAGSGPTSPCCWITNFNIQVSGQNAIYNLEKYNFEQFNNQLYGQNAVNGGLTDGLTSGLIDRQAFDMEYCYYYVNVERMLPVEQSVPKSIQILGTNLSTKNLDLYCFIEYGVDISIDALTGARV